MGLDIEIRILLDRRFLPSVKQFKQIIVVVLIVF